MIQQPAGAVRKQKRVGRGPGSGTGTTSGKGTKGQKARSGGKVRPGFEGGQMPLYRRVARRGFSNYHFKQKPVLLSLSYIDKIFENDAVIDLSVLQQKKIVGKNTEYVKILSDGEISRKITVSEEISTSRKARDKIEAAGGKILGAIQQESKLEHALDSEVAVNTANDDGNGSTSEDTKLTEHDGVEE